MKNSNFKFFRDFHTNTEAEIFTKMLDEYDIPYSAEIPKTILDEVIVGSGLLPKAIVKLRPEDFIKVNNIIADQMKDMTFADVKDHYLCQLDHNELIEILQRPDEWSIEDSIVAKIILDERGANLSAQDVTRMRKERLDSFHEGKSANLAWMTMYFIFIPFGVFAGEILTIAGIGMCYYYAYGRSTDIDGNKYYIYEEQTRSRAKVFLYVGLVLMSIGLIVMYSTLVSSWLRWSELG